MGEEQRAESPSAGEQAKALRDDLSPSRLNEKLEEVIEERPKAKFVLDFRIVGMALLAAVVVALILLVLVSASIAAIGLVVVFFGGWLIGAQVSYDRRRETVDARAEGDEGEGEDEDEDSGGRAEEEDSPPRQAEARKPDSDEYEGDRGEQEAEQEQEGASSPH